jgi:hypothetical protein
MKNFTSLKNICFYGVSLIVLSIGLYSCGSSQQAYNESDGIYGSPQSKGEVVMVRDTKSDYYQNYFAGENQNSQEIFTDIDAYEGYNDTDTIYVENQYNNGNPPWEQSSSSVTINMNLGFGGYYGWGYPAYGWGYPAYGWGFPAYGWGYSYYGYGWGYPGYAWGYPGYGWGYPGYGWGHYPGYGWGHYPPYYGGYYERATYGKRYANNSGSINGNYGRMNTRNISTENKFNRAYSRSATGRNVASVYGANSRGSNSRYGTTQTNSNRSYQNRSSYNRANNNSNYRSNSSGNNSGSYKRSSAPATRSYSPSSRSSSSGYRGSSSGMRTSSGRRQMSYNNMDASPASSNRNFVKKSTSYESAASNNRVSYSTAKNSDTYQRYVKYVPAAGERSNSNNARSYSGNSNNTSSRTAVKNANTSRKSTSSSSNSRSSYSGSRSSGSSRSSMSSSSVKPASRNSGSVRSNR